MPKPKLTKPELLPVRVAGSLVKDIISDAKRFSKTKDGIVEAALRHLFSLKPEFRKEFYKYLPTKRLGRPLAIFILTGCIAAGGGYGKERPLAMDGRRAVEADDREANAGSNPATPTTINEQRLADAIRIEEGNNPHWLYGIHHKGTIPLTEPEARGRCINTIKHAEREFSGSGNFIEFLSLRYCPANNKSWAHNVSKLYAK